MERVAAIVFGAMVGPVAGAIFGFVLGIVLAPTRNPRQPLEHEWYFMAVGMYVISSAVGGLVMGILLGAMLTKQATLGSLIGMTVGLLAGAIAWHQGIQIVPGDSDPSYTGLTIIVFTLGSGIAGAWIGGLRSTRRDVTRPAQWRSDDSVPPEQEASTQLCSREALKDDRFKKQE